VAGERVKLEVRPRESRGSRDARRLRRQGLIPGVIYGRTEPRAISVPERELRRALSGAGGLHTILDVVLDGGSAQPAVLKDFQTDRVRGTLIHIDLQTVRLDQPIQASVTVSLVGEPVGSREGGVLTQVTREINVEALPMEIPEHFDADVSELAVGDSLRLADLPALEGVTFLDDPDETVLATVAVPTKVEEPEEVVEEGEEGEVPEGEEAPEGAEGAAAPDADESGASGTAEE
jgi:large subunit ribosomal protein L25